MMITASPITRQTVGRTFIVAISVLGVAALAQLGAVVWAFVIRSQMPPPFADASDVPPVLGSVRQGPAVPVDTAFTDPARSGVETLALGSPPKPTPLPARAPGLPEPEQSGRFKEMISQGKLLRDRGDMSTALTRFREAAAMDSRHPEPIFELAVTYEKMQLGDRAAEHWRRIFELGEAAGPFFTAAESRLREVKDAAMRAAITNATQPAMADAEEGIAPGKILGLEKIITEEQPERQSAKRLTLMIPIKVRTGQRIEVRDLTIQVLFYDMVDNQNLVQTTADVSSRFSTAPADWSDTQVETLEVSYRLPAPDPKASRGENRAYYGYLVRLYYKGELQSSAGEPDKLLQQFPPEAKLPAEADKAR
ncbi:MAG TPA: hypothetical protein VGO90_00950 [Chthoniobacteraceae bacterium]|jgi:hypothetical protein|nr:hypothetical protein [Chthoniobacteraceae bacterium]